MQLENDENRQVFESWKKSDFTKAFFKFLMEEYDEAIKRILVQGCLPSGNSTQTMLNIGKDIGKLNLIQCINQIDFDILIRYIE